MDRAIRTKVCRDCGVSFTTPDKDVVMCPECVLAMLREDGEEQAFALFEVEYGTEVRAGWRRSEPEPGGYLEAMAALPAAERRRLLRGEWPND